jgi:(2Fe-2S) ferredoxin
MDAAKIPFRKTLFVCMHSREDGRAACANLGKDAGAILRKLKGAVREAGLTEQIRVAKSGCLDLCEKGPNAFMYPAGEWFCGLKETDVDTVVEKLKT